MITRTRARQLWINALRSGKYRQGKEVLCQLNPSGNDKYCCLGVAAEILGAHVDLYPKVDNEDRRTWGGEVASMPRVLVALLGLLDDTGGKRDRRGNCASLVYHNDDLNSTFIEIADLLESGDYWNED